MDKYKDYRLDRKPHKNVRIAILDTGIARSSSQGPQGIPRLIADRRVHIKFGKTLDKSLPPNEDTDGHGTHAAGLLLKVCPYADIYVYRVLRNDNEPINSKHVTAALTHAIDGLGVDIVSISLGWDEDSDPELRDVLDYAKRKNVLVFAASSNEGIETPGGMAYPARADEVIAIDAANYYGEPSKFNPPEGDGERFTALGEAVESAYPTHLAVEGEVKGFKKKSGTSCATPIAAAIAALILEFARQPPLCFDPAVEGHLKKLAGMREVFRKLLSQKKAQASHFYHLKPISLFYCNSAYKDGGEWCELMSPRFKTAIKIVECLRDFFHSGIGNLMEQKVYEEWHRRKSQ